MGSIWQSHRSRLRPTVARLTVASVRAGASEDHRTPTANHAFRVAPLLVDDRAGTPCFGQGPVRTTVPTVASRCFCVSSLPVDPGTVSHEGCAGPPTLPSPSRCFRLPRFWRETGLDTLLRRGPVRTVIPTVDPVAFAFLRPWWMTGTVGHKGTVAGPPSPLLTAPPPQASPPPSSTPTVC